MAKATSKSNASMREYWHQQYLKRKTKHGKYWRKKRKQKAKRR